jgi:hypothetical protein
MFSEASELLDGLKAAGFVPLVRQLLENVQGDTRLSQMETELNSKFLFFLFAKY